MNKNITEEELLLRKRARRRLVGAIVLVVAAIIVLPMIFDEPKPDTESHEIDIHLFPKEDLAEIPPLVLPPEDFPAHDSNEAIDQSDLSSDSVQDFSQALQSSDQMNDEIDKDSANEAKSHIPIPGIKPRFLAGRESESSNQQSGHDLQAYVIQLGAFSDPSKAQKQLDNLVSNGINAYTETHSINGNVVTRVRIGPFSNRSTAENELEELKQLGMDGVVTPR